MILTDIAIKRAHRLGDITIEPFEQSRLGPNWVEASLGNELALINETEINPQKKLCTEQIKIPSNGMILEPGRFYLGYVREVIGSDKYVPLLHATEEIAERGLFVHVTANVVDIGNHANFSLHLVPTMRIRLRPGDIICRVSFWHVFGDINLYNGKYKNTRGVAPSKSYLHFPFK